MNRLLAALIALVFLVCPVSAQFLAEKVPDDAVFFVSWKGTDSLGDSYNQSNTKKLVDASDIAKLSLEYIDRAANRAKSISPRDGEAIASALRLFRYAIHHPTALYFGPVDVTNPRNPAPSVAFICDAGDDAAKLQADLRKLITQARVRPQDARMIMQGNTIILEIGSAHLAEVAKPLANDETFKKALSTGQGDAVGLIYVSGQGVVKLTNDLISTSRNPETVVRGRKIVDALGFNGLQSVCWTGGFAAGNWQTQTHVAMPIEGRKGLLSLLDSKPLSDGLLKMIPSTSTTAFAFHLDLARITQAIREALAKVDPNALEQYEQALDKAAQFVNMDVEKDLLAPLGDEWALAIDPASGGGGMLGAVLVNHLRDPAKFEQSISKLENQANNVMGPLLALNRMSMSFRPGEYDGIKYHYLTSPVISPAWTIHEGNLLVAFYPQVLISTIANQKTGKSILDNPAYASVVKQLGQDKITGLSFYDLPRSAGDGYQLWLLLSRLGFGAGDIFGIQSPPIVIPPWHKIQPLLSPAGSVSWVDEQGWHSKSLSPFPAAETLSTSGLISAVGPAQGAVMAGILLPSLNRARETANRTKCMSNLRQIGMACLLFANENKGKYPRSQGEMVRTQDITPEVFICPASNVAMDDEARNGTIDQKVDWVEKNSCYVYVGAGKNSSKVGPEEVIAYEKMENHDNEGSGILYGDGHVEWHPRPQAMEIIQRAKAAKPDRRDEGGL